MSDEIPTLPPAVTPWYSDKAVHAVLTFLFTLVANTIGRKFGFSLNVEEIVALATVILGFIAGHKWKSATLPGRADQGRPVDAPGRLEEAA